MGYTSPRFPYVTCRLEDTASQAEGADKLQANLRASEEGRLAALAAQSKAEEQVALVQGLLDKLVASLAAHEQHEKLQQHHTAGEGHVECKTVPPEVESMNGLDCRRHLHLGPWLKAR